MRFRIKSGQSAHRFVFDRTPSPAKPPQPVSYTHLTLPTIYSV